MIKFKLSFLTVINSFLFYFLLLLTFLVWYGKLAFGHGLGDLFYAMTLTLVMLVDGGLIYHGIRKLSGQTQSRYFMTLALTISICVIYFVYSFTLGRGVEYKWNGEVFYQNNVSKSTGR